MTLALRIPPVIVLVTAGVLQQLIIIFFNHAGHPAMKITAALLVIIAVTIGITAIVQFRRHQTTVDPRYPQRTSSMITRGVFRVSRNPLYLAMALLLAAQTLWLASWLTLIPVIGFCAYIQYFQIIPEEKALQRHFGAGYKRYRQRTRRWLGMKFTDAAK